MFEIASDKSIKITRADTATFTISLTNETLKTGDKVYLTVKETAGDETPALQLVVTEFYDGKCVFNFSSQDTNIPADDYLYDIQIDFQDGRRYTIMYPTKFKVVEEITSNY